MDAHRQQEFPFPAIAEREDMIKALRFKRGIGCAEASLKIVLENIGRYQESWQTQLTLADGKISRATCQRAISVLEGLDLITTERKYCAQAKEIRNFHRVNWSEVRRVIDRQQDANRPKPQIEANRGFNSNRPKPQIEANRSLNSNRPKPQIEADRSLNSNRPKPQIEADRSLKLRHNTEVTKHTHTHTPTKPVVTRPGMGNSTSARRRPTIPVGECVCAFLDLGVRQASTLVAQALDRGCDTRGLMAIARWFVRSQRDHPTRWRKPATVLMIRLSEAWPKLPAHKGWPAGTPARPMQSRIVDREEYQAARERAREFAQRSPSMAHQLAAAKRRAEERDKVTETAQGGVAK